MIRNTNSEWTFSGESFSEIVSASWCIAGMSREEGPYYTVSLSSFSALGACGITSLVWQGCGELEGVGKNNLLKKVRNSSSGDVYNAMVLTHAQGNFRKGRMDAFKLVTFLGIPTASLIVSFLQLKQELLKRKRVVSSNACI